MLFPAAWASHIPDLTRYSTQELPRRKPYLNGATVVIVEARYGHSLRAQRGILPPRRGKKIVAPGKAAPAAATRGLDALKILPPPVRHERVGGGRGWVPPQLRWHRPNAPFRPEF